MDIVTGRFYGLWTHRQQMTLQLRLKVQAVKLAWLYMGNSAHSIQPKGRKHLSLELLLLGRWKHGAAQNWTQEHHVVCERKCACECVLEMMGIFLSLPRLPRVDVALDSHFSYSPTYWADQINTLHVFAAQLRNSQCSRGLLLLKDGRPSLQPPAPLLPQGAWEASLQSDHSALGPHPGVMLQHSESSSWGLETLGCSWCQG